MTDTVGAHPLLLHLEPPPGAPSSSRLPPSPREAPLSERLLRLWTERGDFSKFSIDQLNDELDAPAKEGEAKASDSVAIGWGPDGEESYGKLAAEQDHKGKAKEVDTSPMTMEEFVQLKEDIMGRLQIAQQSLYSSQALVSLLVASHKSKGAQQNLALDSASVAATRPGSIAASRAESPAPSNASAGVGGEKRHPAGSAAAVEAEFGLDPYSIALTSIERSNIKNESLHQPSEERTGGGDLKSRRKLITLPEFEHEAERDEYTEGRRTALAHKRQSMARAIDILRAGAQRLGGETTSAEVLQPGQISEIESAPASSKRSATDSAQRWRALRQAQSNGWGITPGRPGRSAFGARMRLDEGEQDAWIGFGIPESKPQYRRTALAYLRRDMPTDTGSATGSDKTKRDGDLLVFASRLKKRLRVAFVFQSGERGDEEISIMSEPLRAHQEDGESETIDDSLRSAQAELADRELFDEVVAEARILSSQGAVNSLHTDESVTINIGPTMRLVFQMVEADVGGTETATGSGGVDENVRKDVGKTSSDTSALLSLVIAYLKLSLVKRYQSRADAVLAKETKPSSGTRPAGTTGAAAAASNKGDATDPTGPTKAKVAPAVSDASTKPAATAPVDPWEQASFLLPLLALLHYLSFTSQVRQILSSNGTSSQQPQKSDSYSFDAFQSLPSPARWLNAFLYGSPKEVKGAMRSLSGSGTIFSSQNSENAEKTVLLEVTCRYPDELSIHLPLRRRVDGALGVTLGRIGLGELREIVKEISEEK
ncbi:hypothetical protein BCV69DRAFT_281823 [Microstroma glucosiphilum]|uniref:Mediator of RNA polymerase II transcription subunit 17 n=1 Tax=Pseudomicrostroma glucosiphilum TaxID=1684307 RepID=A0A316U9M8_9BASI|nr:hypothetical protein BCV69DRAFT_281823 [Pseudomicrostroma glucosiphilum]PWN21916.1 hypothetical protein BCV69DRAFT_281823 [Pseudomicrostroma glucosiphilum]